MSVDKIIMLNTTMVLNGVKSFKDIELDLLCMVLKRGYLYQLILISMFY